MKKVILLLALFVSTMSFSQNQKEQELIKVDIGEYKANDKMFKAQALVNKDTTLVCYYELPATHGTPENYFYEFNPVFVIACTITMKDELLKIYDKYVEWTEVAKENTVGKFAKEIELDYPLYGVIFNKKAKGYPKMKKFGTHRFKFNLFDTAKTPSLISNKYFNDNSGMMDWGFLTTGLVFKSPEEFKAFIEFLDPEKVKKRLKEGKVFLFN